MKTTGPACAIVAALLLAHPGAARADDERDDFQASIYLGLAVDTFAASDLNHYLNQDVSGDPKERGIAGVDFAYRLLGQAARTRQLWVYGETVHGTRSADVDCTRAPDLPSCEPFQGQISPTGQFVYMLRNATSLEGFLGLRWEFLAIKPGSRNPAHAYLKAQAGFLSVSGGGGDVADVHHVGLGLTLTSGEFLDSYLEIGFGRTDLFRDRSTRRFKIDGFLSHPLGGTPYARAWEVRAFVEMTVDTDLGPGSDSIQSYVGFDFTPRKGHGRPAAPGPPERKG